MKINYLNIVVSQSKRQMLLGLVITASMTHTEIVDAKSSLVDCDALGRFATLSLMNRVIGVPYQPTAVDIYLEAPNTSERTTQSSKLAIFSDVYEEGTLHKNPDSYGAEIRRHCLRGEFLEERPPSSVN